MRSYYDLIGRSKRSILLRITVIAVVLCAFAAIPLLASSAQPSQAEFMIENKSDWDIHHLYLSPTDDNRWGSDQLGDHVLKSGTSFTLHSIPCDDYDIKVVDDDGDECVIQGITMCKDHTHWTLTNKELLKCEGFGR